uniref:Putative ovule protein n=1 Tax=Solanum chacoense TaxID=4108 RepID=A0A0V0H3Q5_SOLCH
MMGLNLEPHLDILDLTISTRSRNECTKSSFSHFLYPSAAILPFKLTRPAHSLRISIARGTLSHQRYDLLFFPI